jgi:hypothetical protein
MVISSLVRVDHLSNCRRCVEKFKMLWPEAPNVQLVGAYEIPDRSEKRPQFLPGQIEVSCTKSRQIGLGAQRREPIVKSDVVQPVASQNQRKGRRADMVSRYSTLYT